MEIIKDFYYNAKSFLELSDLIEDSTINLEESLSNTLENDFKDDDQEIDVTLADVFKKIDKNKLSEEIKLSLSSFYFISNYLKTDTVKIKSLKGENINIDDKIGYKGEFYQLNQLLASVGYLVNEDNFSGFSFKKGMNCLGQNYYSINVIKDFKEVAAIEFYAVKYNSTIQYRPFTRIINLFTKD
jgi:hypothetical protein